MSRLAAATLLALVLPPEGFGQHHVVFVTTHDGVLHALDLADGARGWQIVLNEVTRSSPSLGIADGIPQLFVGTRLHSIFGLEDRKSVV